MLRFFLTQDVVLVENLLVNLSSQFEREREREKESCVCPFMHVVADGEPRSQR